MIEIKNRVVDAINEINVANDKEVIKLQFKCKNQVTDLIKLSDCTLFINYQNGSLKDRYAVQDLTVNGENVTFSWTLGRNATAKSGKTYFVVCAVKMNGSDIEQEWNSVLTSFDVKKGLETITAPTKEMQDLFAELTEMVEGRLTPDNIKAGQNVTVEIDGNDVTIASTGGSGNISVDNSLYKNNDTIGVDFSTYDPTDEQTPFDKPNNALSASTIVSVLAKVSGDLTDEFTIALNGKQNVLTAGTGISIVNDVISATLGWSVEVLQSLPASGQPQTFYFVAKQDSEQGDVYDEYIWINNAFELIGSTQVDLTNYVTLTDLATELLNYYTKTQIDSLLSGKADSFTVGQNLSLSSGVLSAIITGALKFSNTLPPTGTSGALYLIPNGLPSDLVTYVNLAYDKWGSLSSYPYLMWYENDNTKYIQFLTATVRHTDSGYIAGSGSGGSGVSRRTIAVSKLDGTIIYSTGSSVNDWTNNIVYSNFDVRQNNVSSGEVYFTANVDSTIDYSSGATITTSFKGYTYDGTQFVSQGTTDLTKLLGDYALKSEVEAELSGKQNTVSKVTISNNSTVALADNTDYAGTDLTTVTFTYPQGNFECYMSLSFASSGTITVTFPTSQYIGSVPTFENGKTYEISIKNGVIVAGEVTSGA